MPLQTIFTVIASGDTHSPEVDLKRAQIFGLWVPTMVPSAAMFVKGSFNQTSANFTRVQNPAGSGDWTFAAGPGSKCVTLEQAVTPFPFIKIETAVAVTTPFSLALIVKLF